MYIHSSFFSIIIEVVQILKQCQEKNFSNTFMAFIFRYDFFQPTVQKLANVSSKQHKETESTDHAICDSIIDRKVISAQDDDSKTIGNNTVNKSDENKEEQSENNDVPINEDFECLKHLANFLGAIITLFTNLEHCWVIPIFPDNFNLHSCHFFMVYRFQRFFPAWLKSRSAVAAVRTINLKRQGKDPKCRCGRGTQGKEGQGRCSSTGKEKYLTRCICFRLDRPCGLQCDCRNCENPYGLRPDKSRYKKPKIPYRTRYAHEAAKIATCKSSVAKNTIAIQTPYSPEIADTENVIEGWVPLEHCIFEALINEIKSPPDVQQRFNEIVKNMTAISGLENIAYIKSSEEISLKLQQRERDISEYLKIYQKQADVSIG